MNPAMRNKYGRQDTYVTDSPGKSLMPTPEFFLRMCLGPLAWLWRLAKSGKCDDVAWIHGSAWFADIFENIGGTIKVSGLGNLDELNGTPCVFIANHMSALETFLLPGMIRPRMPVTFVVKKSLVALPVFGPVMRSRDPVVVGRANPREDLVAVLEEGGRRLANGISVVVFPQATRSPCFEPARFNSIGIKLALKAGVPVIPVALKTDAWGQGAIIKEAARIHPGRPACFRFGAPMRIAGHGKSEHASICRFISETLAGWS